MRNLLFFSILLLATKSFTQSTFEVQYKYTINFGKCINYACPNAGQIDAADSLIEMPEIDANKRIAAFITNNNERVKSRNITVYDDFGEMVYEYDTAYLKYTQYSDDTTVTKDWKGKVTVKAARNYRDYQSVSLLRTVQEWYFNPFNNKLDVVVNGYSPVFSVYDDKGKYKGLRPIYWVKFQSPLSNTNVGNMIRDTSITWAQQVKFQVPLKEKLDGNPYFNDRDMPAIKKLFSTELPEILYNKALQGKIDVYDPITGKKLDSAEINSRIKLTDTILVQDEQGALELKEIVRIINRYELSSLIVKQVFIFDEKNFNITSKIKSITLTYIGSDEKLIELFEFKFAN